MEADMEGEHGRGQRFVGSFEVESVRRGT